MDNQVSSYDVDNLQKIRSNVNEFLAYVSDRYVTPGASFLDIAPQDHQGAKPFLHSSIEYHTLDIDSSSGATYISDLSNCSRVISDCTYDYVACTEVLEHTLQPFHAVSSIHRILMPGGLTFISTPFDFRIHGPLPDCWRFTEHGLRELFKSFEILELNPLETNDRFLMPIQYTLVAKKI